MARKKVPTEQLEAEIANILKEYENDTKTMVEEAAVQYGKIGQRKLQETSPKRTGKYAKGWAWRRTSRKKRLGPEPVTLHNRAKPGLAHLLEHGHAKRGGGRVEGIEHIAPVEAEIIEGFEKEVLSKIRENS